MDYFFGTQCILSVICRYIAEIYATEFDAVEV